MQIPQSIFLQEQVPGEDYWPCEHLKCYSLIMYSLDVSQEVISDPSRIVTSSLRSAKPKFEELVFGTPATPVKQAMWEWITLMTPPSTPALASYSISSTRALSPEEEPPSAALAFYTFINGDYLPELFVDDPEIFFLSGPTSNLQSPNHPATHYDLVVGMVAQSLFISNDK
ncbi:hypothetical protein O181_112482 [Austropuccinia psidii MF-1]|uniref:Uncharacterized protein n=1 Tax=Austropuccinia psidii MF-1 TaxID=1389203 RepID=A0A9Q3PUF0_9BASI|nr:hypothetical protein [Austropuccinia psidii MF-1]